MSSNILQFRGTGKYSLRNSSKIPPKHKSSSISRDNVTPISVGDQRAIYLTSGLWINDAGFFSRDETLQYCPKINPSSDLFQSHLQDCMYISSVRDFIRFKSKCRNPQLGFLFSTTIPQSFQDLSPIEFFVLHNTQSTEFERIFKLENRGKLRREFSQINGTFFIPQKNSEFGIAILGAKSRRNQEEFSQYLSSLGYARDYFFL